MERQRSSIFDLGKTRKGLFSTLHGSVHNVVVPSIGMLCGVNGKRMGVVGCTLDLMAVSCNSVPCVYLLHPHKRVRDSVVLLSHLRYIDYCVDVLDRNGVSDGVVGDGVGMDDINTGSIDDMNRKGGGGGGGVTSVDNDDDKVPKHMTIPSALVSIDGGIWILLNHMYTSTSKVSSHRLYSQLQSACIRSILMRRQGNYDHGVVFDSGSGGDSDDKQGVKNTVIIDNNTSNIDMLRMAYVPRLSMGVCTPTPHTNHTPSNDSYNISTLNVGRYGMKGLKSLVYECMQRLNTIWGVDSVVWGVVSKYYNDDIMFMLDINERERGRIGVLIDEYLHTITTPKTTTPLHFNKGSDEERWREWVLDTTQRQSAAYEEEKARVEEIQRQKHRVQRQYQHHLDDKVGVVDDIDDIDNVDSDMTSVGTTTTTTTTTITCTCTYTCIPRILTSTQRQAIYRYAVSIADEEAIRKTDSVFNFSFGNLEVSIQTGNIESDDDLDIDVEDDITNSTMVHIWPVGSGRDKCIQREVMKLSGVCVRLQHSVCDVHDSMSDNNTRVCVCIEWSEWETLCEAGCVMSDWNTIQSYLTQDDVDIIMDVLGKVGEIIDDKSQDTDETNPPTSATSSTSTPSQPPLPTISTTSTSTTSSPTSSPYACSECNRLGLSTLGANNTLVCIHGIDEDAVDAIHADLEVEAAVMQLRQDIEMDKLDKHKHT